MKKYDVLFFDLFDTVINFSFTNLPLIELSGVRARTTSKEVYEVFRRRCPDVPFPEFYEHFIGSYREFQYLKLAENREYPNRDRFLMMLSKMDLPADGEGAALADDMVRAHMNGLASAVSFPPENESALSALRDAKYRMAIVSNFDYAPTAYSLIEKFGLMRFFERVIISEEVGWRKPSPVIFEDALKAMGADPGASLFTGDNFHADVAGSKNAGMDSVWLNSRNENTEGLDPEPDYIIPAFPDVLDVLRLS
ncbi:MAG: HAD family hydrolase [Candidatus Dadabacteria bacterium]|nr:HAD family hydrolase [Candidatus Dadabacteria bacterium]